MGSRAGNHGPQCVATLTWLFEARRRQRVLLFHECTEDFNPRLFRNLLADLYEITDILMGPEDLGLWCKRTRRFTVMVLKSAGRLTKTFEHFRNTLFRPRSADSAKGAMYLCAPDQDVHKIFQEMAAAECLAVDGDLSKLSCKECLGGGNFARLQQYQKAREELALTSFYSVAAESGMQPRDLASEAEVVAALKITCESEPWLACITQNHGRKGGWMGQALGTLMTRSLVWSFQHQRVMCGGERLQYQAIPFYTDALRLCFRSAIHDVANELTHAEQRQLAGNAINSYVAACLTVWTVGHFQWHEEALDEADLVDGGVVQPQRKMARFGSG